MEGFNMGLWFEKINTTPPTDEERVVFFKSDPQALSKRWPILWRFCQNWHILKVASSGPFRLYFRSADGQCMRSRRSVSSEYVGVRVGPTDVAFWAVRDSDGEEAKLARMNVSIPGILRKDMRSMWHRQDAERFEDMTQFI